MLVFLIVFFGSISGSDERGEICAKSTVNECKKTDIQGELVQTNKIL